MLRPLLLVFLVAISQAAGQSAPDHVVVPADYATLATITEIVVSPDGKRVAYCEARWDKAEDNRKSDLWVVDTTGKTLDLGAGFWVYRP